MQGPGSVTEVMTVLDFILLIMAIDLKTHQLKTKTYEKNPLQFSTTHRRKPKGLNKMLTLNFKNNFETSSW